MITGTAIRDFLETAKETRTISLRVMVTVRVFSGAWHSISSTSPLSALYRTARGSKQDAFDTERDMVASGRRTFFNFSDQGKMQPFVKESYREIARRKGSVARQTRPKTR